MNHDEYEKEVELITEQNEQYLIYFYDELIEKGLTQKTVQKHVNNMAFYNNDFLNYYDSQPMKQWCYQIDEFLGDWFIRKAMWSNRASVKVNGVSIKKFYKCMLEKGYIELDDYQILVTTIKEPMPSWLDAVDKYNIDLDEYY